MAHAEVVDVLLSHLALSYTTADFTAVIDALDAGILDVKDMITKQIALDRVVDDGILALAQKEKTDIKILVDVRTQKI
jgi:threonine dehydrogenase-like Zn-dependent dehydrogenase